jgi:hypothetical protein
VEIGGPTFESPKRHDSGGLFLTYRGGPQLWVQRRVALSRGPDLQTGDPGTRGR